MRVPLPGLLLLFFVVPPVVAQQKSDYAVPNSPKGFDKQYKTAFNAYEKAFRYTNEYKTLYPEKDLFDRVSSVYKKAFRKTGSSNTAISRSGLDPMERFQIFAIQEHWFTDTFGPVQGPQFAREYQEMFNRFQSATEHEFFTLALRDGSGSYPNALVETKARGTRTTDLRQAPVPLVPLPPVQRFRVRFRVFLPYTYEECGPTGGIDCTSPAVLALGYNNYRSDNFIYVDGAFRFAGAPCPVWAQR